MKTRIFSIAAIAVLLLNIVVPTFADTMTARAKKAQVSRLVSLLPASDGVVVFDSKRFLNEALPKVLSGNQPILGEIMAKMTEMENRTGIDFRKFEQVAVGVSIKQISPTNVDFEPVAIANGDINAGALVAVAKLASKGTYREEKIGDKTVYVFSPKEILQKATVKTTNSKVAGVIDEAFNGLTKEVAVTALDKNTLVLGSLARVQATVEGSSKIAADITGLLSVKETSIASFAAKPPGGLSKMLPLDADDFDAIVDSIEYLAGSIDVATTGASVQIIARTKRIEQAQSLKETLDGLKVVGSAVFAGSKRADQKVYARMIKNARIENRGNEVSLELFVPQADIDILLSGIK